MGSCLGGLRDAEERNRNEAGSRVFGRSPIAMIEFSSPSSVRARSPSHPSLQRSSSCPPPSLSTSPPRFPPSPPSPRYLHDLRVRRRPRSPLPSPSPPSSTSSSGPLFLPLSPSHPSPSSVTSVQVSNANSIPNLTPEDITDHYIIGETLAEGTLRRTVICTEKSTGHQFACKIFMKSNISSETERERWKRELENLKILRGQPNIVEFRAAYESVDANYIVMELCTGGDIFDLISSEGQHTERAIASIIRDIVSAVQVCHDKGVMHGDIKFENFLLSSKDEGAVLKAIGFGHSRVVEEGKGFSDPVDASYYLAPEAIDGLYGKEIDIWSAGVILYLLLSGAAPFSADTEGELRRAIMRCEIDFDSHPWPSVSNNAKELIQKMLTVDPQQRISPKQVLDFPWVRCGDAPDRPLDGAVLARLKKFIAMDNPKIGGSTSESNDNPN